MRHALVFLDFETTGMSPEGDGVTDIGLVRVEPDGTRSEWEQLVNPGRWIPSQITALTGISNAMVAGAPGFGGVADALENRIRGALVVAHNARFDMGFLNAGFARCGIAKRPAHACSVRVARKLFPALKSRSLDALSQHFGLRFEGFRHRALPDAVMLERLWYAMRNAVGEAAFEKAVAALITDGPVETENLFGAPAPLAAALPEPWPYAGPVVMKSTRRESEWHIFHEWRHLGSVRCESEIAVVLATRRDGTPFVEATYRKIVVALATPGAEIRPLA